MTHLPSVRIFDGMFTGLQQVLDLRRMQHTLTASNLANADTPGYHARELSFDSVLRDVMDRALDGDPTDVSREAEDATVERAPLPWSLDGNSVDAEHEAVRLTENSLMYDAIGSGMSRRLSLLRFAATDGKA